MTKQELVETICTQTSISKRDLARWIGTDQSVLSRYVAGTRSLPLKAIQHLLFLHQQLSDLPAPTPTVELPGAEAPDWQQQADACQEKLATLQERYATMGENSAAAAKALQLLDALAADTVMLTPKKERWIAEQRYQAEKLATDNNPVARQKLLIQIVLLQKELELYRSFMSGVPDSVSICNAYHSY